MTSNGKRGQKGRREKGRKRVGIGEKGDYGKRAALHVKFCHLSDLIVLKNLQQDDEEMQDERENGNMQER